MKNVFVIIFVSISYTAFAQSFEINEAPRSKKDGVYNSFLFELPDVEKDEVTKSWEKYMKAFKGKTKYNRKAKVYITENAKIAQLSDAPIMVYQSILGGGKKSTGNISLIVWFDTGDGNYIASETDSLKGAYALQMLNEYAVSVSKQHAESKVKKEEKRLADLEKDLKKLKKNNKDYHKAIDKAKDTIAKNEKNIEVNDLDQKNKLVEIEAQRVALEEAKQQVVVFQH